MHVATAIASSGTFGFLLEFVILPSILLVMLWLTIGRS